MTRNIFLSVGRTATSEQNHFVKAVEELLKEHGLTSRTVGRTDFATEKPLKKILHVMEQCSGTIIVAFERFNYESGTELRGGSNETSLTDVSLPTVWNQIEAGMAYALGHPILAIAESHLHNEGLLEDGYDWFIKWVDLTPESLHSPEFQATFQKWVRNVETFDKKK